MCDNSTWWTTHINVLKWVSFFKFCSFLFNFKSFSFLIDTDLLNTPASIGTQGVESKRIEKFLNTFKWCSDIDLIKVLYVLYWFCYVPTILSAVVIIKKLYPPLDPLAELKRLTSVNPYTIQSLIAIGTVSICENINFFLINYTKTFFYLKRDGIVSITLHK